MVVVGGDTILVFPYLVGTPLDLDNTTTTHTTSPSPSSHRRTNALRNSIHFQKRKLNANTAMLKVLNNVDNVRECDACDHTLNIQLTPHSPQVNTDTHHTVNTLSTSTITPTPHHVTTHNTHHNVKTNNYLINHTAHGERNDNNTSHSNANASDMYEGFTTAPVSQRYTSSLTHPLVNAQHIAINTPALINNAAQHNEIDTDAHVVVDDAQECELSAFQRVFAFEPAIHALSSIAASHVYRVLLLLYIALFVVGVWLLFSRVFDNAACTVMFCVAAVMLLLLSVSVTSSVLLPIVMRTFDFAYLLAHILIATIFMFISLAQHYAMFLALSASFSALIMMIVSIIDDA